MTSTIDHRERKCELGYLQRADGSCLYSFGATVALASVNGPGDLRSTKQLSDRALIETFFHTKVGGSATSSINNTAANRNVERHLQMVCESSLLARLFPRSSIIVTVQEMHNDGGLAASAVNATCMALLDAGLPMRSIFAAVSCILSKSDDGSDEILLIEPNSRQESERVVAKMLFVFESNGEFVSGDEGEPDVGPSLSLCSMEGVMSRDQLKGAQDLAREASMDVFQLYRTSVAKKFGRRMEFTDRRGVAMEEK